MQRSSEEFLGASLLAVLPPLRINANDPRNARSSDNQVNQPAGTRDETRTRTATAGLSLSCKTTMHGTRTSDYDFQLPPELIAQSPPAVRGESRLMVVDRATQTIAHRRFADIVEYIPSGDVLVRNTTRVMRARLLGTRDSGAPAEILLLKSLGDSRYEEIGRA